MPKRSFVLFSNLKQAMNFKLKIYLTFKDKIKNTI